MKQMFLPLFMVAVAATTAFGQTPSPTTAPTLRIVTEDAALPSELYYGDIKVKPLRLRPGTSQVITIGDADFFVQQHYIDFLRRFPDQPGLQHWMAEITACGGDAACIDRKRTNTSGAFFLSTEFQTTGYFIYRIYKGALGRAPQYTEFIAEMKQLTNGIVVNNQLSDQTIENNKNAFIAQFVARQDFKSKFDALDNAQYVRGLFNGTGVTVSAADESALINGLNSATENRASVLRKVLDGTRTVNNGNLEFTTTYGRAFYDKEFNAAFVTMQYFGYLRRDPDEAGFKHWLDKLNLYGNFTDAEMVRAFLVSDEYNRRF